MELFTKAKIGFGIKWPNNNWHSIKPINQIIWPLLVRAQSAGPLEYTYCISAEE